MWAVVIVTEFSFTIFQINDRWSYYMQLSLLTRCLCGPFSLSFFLLETIAVTFGNQAFGSGRFDILQWLIQGGPGDPLPLFLDQTEVRRAEKNFLETVPPLFKGLDDLPPSPRYLKVWIRHCTLRQKQEKKKMF